MSVKLIAAIGENGELGKNNDLIWHLPKDKRFFKETTMGKYVVMGRRTFESLPNSLPGRTMIVVSSKKLDNYYDVICYNNPLDVIDHFEKDELFVIGGGLIYEEFMPFASEMYLTEVLAHDYEADTYFPQINPREWHVKEIESGVDNGIDYVRNHYVRKRVIR